LSIDSVEYQGWQSRLYRDPEGQWSVARLVDVVNRLAADPSASEEETMTGVGEAGTGEAPAAEPLRYLVSRMETVGENNRLVLVDESVTPAIAVTVDLQRLVIEDVDTADTNTPWLLDLQAGIGKHSQINTAGEFNPMSEPPAVNMTANVTALDLPWLSSYTRDSLGLLLKSGTLDAELSLETLDSEVSGAANLRLHQLAVENLPGENTLQSSIPVPLNTALSTLRDKNNTIQLEIPISGDISDPSFDIKDALTQALAKGVQKGALSYLTFALQPYGTLIAAAKIAGEAATRVSLNPVFFDAGQSQLTDRSLDYLSKVAAVLEDRPDVTVKLCGVAADADRVYFEQQRQASSADAIAGTGTGGAVDPGADDDTDTLTQIAEERAAAVKDHLVDEFGVSASRLVGCLARLEVADPAAQPRVDLLL
jgi:outer membrane protein OmpA-like peptidoglycan-associated protein